MSRSAPPPTAVITPSRIAGSQPRPAASVFNAPAAAHDPSAMPSTTGHTRCHIRPRTRMPNMSAAAVNAVSTYA